MSSTELDHFSTFGELLKHLRQRARLTQRELGLAVGYSDAHITRLERGQRLPDPSAVHARFIDALDLRDEPILAQRLMELAEQAQGDDTGHAGASSAATIPTNLPVQLTNFVGREQDIAEVKGLLGTHRLVTLTGSGGVGKTRLAQEVAAQALRAHAFPDGMWLVELAPLTDSKLVADAVVSTLSLGGSNRPALALLVDHLRQQHALLLLDNCEHLIQACAELAEALLRACPRLHLLATSRERLNVGGEIAWRVPSLSADETLQLFGTRARAVRPDFVLSGENTPTVAGICARLDGIPLAIELAASRLSGLSVEELTVRLADRLRLLTGGSRTALPRHQTVRAAIDWSYELLSEQERALLRQLAVFKNGWTAEAVEQVCAEPAPSDILTLLLSLADKSLVIANERQGETRYGMLETIREYAWEQLAACGEADEVRRRHARYYLAFVQAHAPPDMRRTQAPVQMGVMTDSLPWLRRLDVERDNLWAALAWCLHEAHDSRVVDTGIQLALWLSDYWGRRGPRPEGRAWLESALAHTDPAERTLTRARLLGALTRPVLFMGEGTQAEAYAREALAICRALGERYDIMIALWRLSNLAHSVEELHALNKEWLSIARDLGDARAIGMALWYLGNIFQAQRDFPQAAAVYEESLSALPVSEEEARQIARYFQGTMMWEQDRSERGLAQVYESLAHFRGSGFELGVIIALHWLGDAALSQGDLPPARQHLRKALTEAYRDGAWGLFAECLGSFAVLAVAEGQPTRAVTLWSAAEAISASLATSDYRGRIDTARGQLDEKMIAAAEATGRAMSYDQVLVYALQGDESDELPTT